MVWRGPRSVARRLGVGDVVYYNVVGLLKGGVGDTRVYAFTEPVQLDPSVNLTRPVVGRVKLTRTNQGILAQGSVETEAELQCGRCLAPTRQPVRLEFAEEYYPDR